VDPLFALAAAEHLEMAVEPFVLCEEIDIGEEPIEDPDRIVRVKGRDELIAGVFDGFQVPLCNESRCTGHCEVLHKEAV
jgi:hypothetical protein